MFRKLRILIYKDILLLTRDRPGFALIFIMPLFMVLIMANLQDSTFRSINENSITIAVVDKDQDSLSIMIIRELKNSDIFEVHLISSGISEKQLRDTIALGFYQIGILIPEKTTQKIRKSVARKVIYAFEGQKAPVPAVKDTSIVRIFLDPTTKPSFRELITGTIQQYTSAIEHKVTLNEIKKEISERLPFDDQDIMPEQVVSFREEYAISDSSNIIPNSVQHNVPAWTLFAMFFIVMSLAGNMIKEREDGSHARLMVMPCSPGLYLSAKMLTYLGVCVLQFVLLMVMGVFILPMMGLPALNLGSSWFGLLLVVVSSALAAICFGLVVGALANTHQQSSTFGSIAVVILAAIGGIWVPVFTMPAMMRAISAFSPMNWGLEGFYDIFVRNLGATSVLPEVLKLMIFAILCFAISMAVFRKQRKL
jgi:ABC-2 type transport system permease protein